MGLDLVHCRYDLGRLEEDLKVLHRVVGDTDGLDFACQIDGTRRTGKGWGEGGV